MKIKIIALRVNQPAKVEEIENTLRVMQQFVGGTIDMVPADLDEDDNVDICLNDDGKLIGLPVNRPLWGGADYLVGDAFIAAVDPETGENISLTDKQIEKYLEMYNGFYLKIKDKKENK